VFGKGFAEIRRRNLPYYSATKTFASTEDAIRKEIEAQLKRMDVSSIDFYHIWCITNLDNWRERKQNKILQTFRKLKDEGLIKHICVSSHLMGDDIKELLMEELFEGALFGYSAYNFKTREAAFDAIRSKKLGAVVMNPLGGGVIPQHPERFDFIRRSGESAVTAALRFLWDHPEITVTLVGFDNIEQVQEAVSAMDGYKARSAEELAALKSGIHASLEGICTGCAYCDDCPEDIPVPKFMDAYNQGMLTAPEKKNQRIEGRLKWHWGLDRAIAGKCSACGQCEEACTQHIKIIERLKEIGGQTTG
jgi:predicted aldo/keto reductase-like oxidoreductase